MTASQIPAIQAICERAISRPGATVTIDIVEGRIQIIAGSWTAQQQVLRELGFLGWQVAEGDTGTLTILGWSTTRLKHRRTTLAMACDNLRRGHESSALAAITAVEHHLATRPGDDLPAIGAELRAATRHRLKWPLRLEQAARLDRRCEDPLFAPHLAKVIAAETELRRLCDQHLLVALTAAEVAIKCVRSMSWPGAREVALREAMVRLHGDLTTAPSAALPALR
jgi:hypothetical protein